MKKKDLKNFIKKDLQRAYGQANLKVFLKGLISIHGNVGFKYMFIFRITQYFVGKNKIIFKLFLRKLRKQQFKYGIEIPYITDIGEGLSMPHFGGIVIHGNTKIGKNCTILQGVTIGNNVFKSRNEVAKIGDNVTICSGAKIIGNIKIGNNVTIGANAVVTKDVEDNSIIGGNPAKVISVREPIIINSI